MFANKNRLALRFEGWSVQLFLLLLDRRMQQLYGVHTMDNRMNGFSFQFVLVQSSCWKSCKFWQFSERKHCSENSVNFVHERLLFCILIENFSTIWSQCGKQLCTHARSTHKLPKSMCGHNAYEAHFAAEKKDKKFKLILSDLELPSWKGTAKIEVCLANFWSSRPEGFPIEPLS